MPLKVNEEFKAIKSLVQGLIGGSREESKIVDLERLIPKEQAKIKDKIQLYSLFIDKYPIFLF